MAQEQNNTTKICTDYHTHTIVKLSTHTSKTLAHFTVKPPTYTKQLKACKHTQKNLEPLQQNVIYLFFFTVLPFHPSFFHPLRRPETSRDPWSRPDLRQHSPGALEASGHQVSMQLHPGKKDGRWVGADIRQAVEIPSLPFYLSSKEICWK